MSKAGRAGLAMVSERYPPARWQTPCFRATKRHVKIMKERSQRIIDMTPDGEFVVPQNAPPPRNAWAVRLGVSAAMIAAVAGALAVAAVFLWLASILIPVAVVAGLVAYGAFRFQIWRAHQSLRR